MSLAFLELCNLGSCENFCNHNQFIDVQRQSSNIYQIASQPSHLSFLCVDTQKHQNFESWFLYSHDLGKHEPSHQALITYYLKSNSSYQLFIAPKDHLFCLNFHMLVTVDTTTTQSCEQLMSKHQARNISILFEKPITYSIVTFIKQEKKIYTLIYVFVILAPC